MKLKRIIWLFISGLFMGCSTMIPINAKKNGENQGQKNSASFFDNLFSHHEYADPDKESHENRLSQNTLRSQNKRILSQRFPSKGLIELPNAIGLTPVDGNTWRTSIHPAMVFGIMSRIISQTYIISSMDRKNFNLQTDWDKFFIDGRLFRNRINVMVFPVGPKQTEVVIKNIVEYYTGNPNYKMEENTAWLPTPDITDEIPKLVENTNRQTALALTQTNLR